MVVVYLEAMFDAYRLECLGQSPHKALDFSRRTADSTVEQVLYVTFQGNGLKLYPV